METRRLLGSRQDCRQVEIQGGKQPEKCEAGPVDRRALKKITLSASSIFRRVESGYLGSYEDGLAAGVSFRDLLPYETHGSAVVSRFHGTLLSRSLRSFFFFFPFPSRVSADCDPSSTIGVSSKIVYKGRNKRGEDRSIVFGNIYSEREKVFFKGWRFKSIDDTNCSRFEEERMENKLAYVIYSSLPRGRRSTNTRIKMRNRKVSREKEDG